MILILKFSMSGVLNGARVKEVLFLAGGFVGVTWECLIRSLLDYMIELGLKHIRVLKALMGIAGEEVEKEITGFKPD